MMVSSRTTGYSSLWAVYHDPTVPRTREGKPNLSASVPRLNGKPDLSGIWQAESAPVVEIQRDLGFGRRVNTENGATESSDRAAPPTSKPFQGLRVKANWRFGGCST